MDTMFTPWRKKYITGKDASADKIPSSGCVFCEAINAADGDALIVARSVHVFAILNLFPYNSGHLMVIPYQHVSTPEDLPDDALLDLLVTTNRAIRVLREAYQPHAFNLGANIGQAAGAGIAQHYHFHIVPRWSGDANFMTTIGETRVIPDTLENMQQELKSIWDRLYPSSR